MNTNQTNSMTDSIRNVAVIAHGGAGKTSLIESLLFQAGEIPEKGAVDKGKATMLTEPEEISHHMAIGVHVGHLKWRESSLHFVDTPGYFNFIEAGRGVLPTVDGSLFLFSGVDGVKPETEKLWSMVKEANLPILGFFTQMDSEEANLSEAITKVEKLLGLHVQPITFPVRSNNELIGVVDLIQQKLHSVSGKKVSVSEIPAAMKDDIERARVHLIERIAENSEELLNKYLGGSPLTEDELITGLKNSLLKRDFIPAICGSARTGVGISLLLDYLVSCMPSPVERDELRPIIGMDPYHHEKLVTRKCSLDEPFCAEIIRTIIDPFFGKLSIARIFSGEIRNNNHIFNSTRKQKEKAGHVYLLQGKELTQVECLSAGEFGAIAKLEESHTGDTLCDNDHQIYFESVQFAPAVVAYAVEADVKSEEKVSAALTKLTDEDPSLHFYRDEQTHQMILSGMGQTHIEVSLEKLERKFGAHAILKAPKVPYRETIRHSVKVQGKLKKQSGGHGQFANTMIEVSPLPRNAGFEFVDEIKGGVIPKQYIPSVKKGVEEAMQKGILGGNPVVDLKVVLYDGSFHDVDSSDYAFQVAGSMGLKEALEKGESVLLEPIMSLRISIPEIYSGNIIKDISGRRGKVLGFEVNGEWRDIQAEAPMAEVLEYGNHLGAMTSGRGTYTMHVTNYQEVPPYLAEKVLHSAGKKDKAA